MAAGIASQIWSLERFVAPMLDLRVSGLESAQLKLARVAVHLHEIRYLISEATRKANTYKIIKDSNGKDTVQFLVPPPRDISVIIGEIVYQFKSALDHLAFELVQSNPAKIILPKNWVRDCQFPLCLNIPTHGNPPIVYDLPVPIEFFEPKLPGISKAAYAFIESVQPYNRGAGIHNVLRIVAKLANIDKHHHLHIMVPRVAVHHHVTYSNGFTGASTVGGLKHGAEVPLFTEIEGNPTVNMDRTFSPYVTFDAETIGQGPDTLESQNVLEVILRQFKSVIIPTFAQLLENT
jgi:hypothetical protein